MSTSGTRKILGTAPQDFSFPDRSIFTRLTATAGPLNGAPAFTLISITPLDKDLRALAALAYGEASVNNIYEEMAAIAMVVVRQQKCRGYDSVSEFLKKDKTFAFAAHDGNPRYKKFTSAKDADVEQDFGMATALRGARNALSTEPIDYSNGAYFWDGIDIKTRYTTHPKVKAGIHFTDSAHNVLDIKEKEVPGESWWKDAHGKKTKLRGKWLYKYESTAGIGSTIFWKYNEDFLKATNNKEYN